MTNFDLSKLESVDISLKLNWKKEETPKPGPVITPPKEPKPSHIRYVAKGEKLLYSTDKMIPFDRTKLEAAGLGVLIFEKRAHTTSRGSFVGARVGDFMDILYPIDSPGHSDKPHLVEVIVYDHAPNTAIDLHKLIPLKEINHSLQVINWTMPEPSIPFYMLCDPWDIVRGHYGQWHKNHDLLAERYLQELRWHRIEPYGHQRSYNDHIYREEHSRKDVFLPISSVRMQPSWLDQLESEAQRVIKLGKRPISFFVDEPPKSTFPELAEKLRKAIFRAPSVKFMVTTDWDPILEEVDIFCPVLNHLQRSPYLYDGKELWGYVSCMSHGCGNQGDIHNLPDFVVDRPEIYARVFPWFAYKLGLTGMLYYNCVEGYKTKNNFLFGGNLDGTLFYPDIENVRPLPSMRLKNLLQGMQDLEYLKLGEKMDPSWTRNNVKALVSVDGFNKIEYSYDGIIQKIAKHHFELI